MKQSKNFVAKTCRNMRGKIGINICPKKAEFVVCTKQIPFCTVLLQKECFCLAKPVHPTVVLQRAEGEQQKGRNYFLEETKVGKV